MKIQVGTSDDLDVFANNEIETGFSDADVNNIMHIAIELSRMPFISYVHVLADSGDRVATFIEGEIRGEKDGHWVVDYAPDDQRSWMNDDPLYHPDDS